MEKLPGPIQFKEPNTFFKKTLQNVDNYCSWSGKKVLALNDKNEAIVQKRSTNCLLTVAKVFSCCTLIIPAIMYSLRAILHSKFKAVILDPMSPTLSLEQKTLLYPLNHDRIAWEKLGYSKEAIINHPVAVNFLKETGIVFTIKAYQNSNYPELKEGIKYDTDHHPMILCEGRYRRVEDFVAEKGLVFHPNKPLLLDKEGKEWDFYPPKGLIQTDWKFSKDQESYKLSEQEMVKLRECGAKFDSDPNKTCFVQVFTSEKAPDEHANPLTKNLNNLDFSHCGVRMILKDGTVHSFAIENKYFNDVLLSSFPTSFLTTVPANISKRDYAELRPYEQRLVTTIPIFETSSNEILDEFEQISKSDNCRFNFKEMNCVAFSQLLLKRIGVDFDCRVSIETLLGRALPDLKSIPGIGPVLSAIRDVYRKAINGIHAVTPQCIRNFLSKVYTVLTYIPNKLSILAFNLFTIALGMRKQSKDIKDKENPNLPQWQRLWSLNKGISWKELFNEEKSLLCWSGELTAWQKKQASTNAFIYDDANPKFHII